MGLSNEQVNCLRDLPGRGHIKFDGMVAITEQEMRAVTVLINEVCIEAPHLFKFDPHTQSRCVYGYNVMQNDKKPQQESVHMADLIAWMREFIAAIQSRLQTEAGMSADLQDILARFPGG